MTRKRIPILLASLGAIALSFYAWGQYIQKNPKRDHSMTQLTKRMKSACVGRYLIDIPADAEISIGSVMISGVKVEYVGSAPGETQFKRKVFSRESELRALKHEIEGTRLLEALDINDGKQRLLVYREEQKDTLLAWVEASVLASDAEWVVKFEAANQDIPEVKSLITKLSAKIVYRNMREIPDTAGYCIMNGLITGSEYETENLVAGIRTESPDFNITLKSETSGPRERGNTLWDRVERAEKDVNEIYGIKLPIGVVRRAEVQVDGRKGQEYVTITPEKGIERFNAKAEIYGDATPKKPTFKIEMDAAWVKNPSKDQKKHMLSKEEALALWDSILKSVRPRPGAF